MKKEIATKEIESVLDEYLAKYKNGETKKAYLMFKLPFELINFSEAAIEEWASKHSNEINFYYWVNPLPVMDKKKTNETHLPVYYLLDGEKIYVLSDKELENLRKPNTVVFINYINNLGLTQPDDIYNILCNVIKNGKYADRFPEADRSCSIENTFLTIAIWETCPEAPEEETPKGFPTDILECFDTYNVIN